MRSAAKSDSDANIISGERERAYRREIAMWVPHLKRFAVSCLCVDFTTLGLSPCVGGEDTGGQRRTKNVALEQPLAPIRGDA